LKKDDMLALQRVKNVAEMHPSLRRNQKTGSAESSVFSAPADDGGL
jgi:hypothetical protein